MSNPYSSPQSEHSTPLPAEAVKAFTPPPGPTFLGHPLGLALLFLVEMWERFSYYGMCALLPLYLAAEIVPKLDPNNPTYYGAGRGWTKEEASVLYGWYTGLAYLTPLVGGLIADRLIGNNRSLLIGGTIIALGHIVLGLSGLGTWAVDETGMTLFVAGLTLIIIGTGHFKPCVSSIVGQLYGDGDPRRDGAFTIFYMGVNLGALLGGLLCGIVSATFGWHWGFGLAAIGMIAGLILFSLTRKRFLGSIGGPPPGKGRAWPSRGFRSRRSAPPASRRCITRACSARYWERSSSGRPTIRRSRR
ncbi:MAG: oligopeptide:H+ symporter [Pirellulales bacterium]